MNSLIFVSYSSKDRVDVATLVTDLIEQYGDGAVWWDRALESRDSFEAQISAALEAARVVLVVWSSNSVESTWVYSEARAAARRGTLMNVRLGNVDIDRIPKPFDVYHLVDIADRANLLTEVSSVMSGVPPKTRISLAELYRLQYGREVLDPKLRSLPRDLKRVSPTDLLQAKYALVAYDDTHGMLARINEWCLSSQSIAACLVFGPGGLGKTRLMIEVAHHLRERCEWSAGFWDHLPETLDAVRQRWQALEQLILHGRSNVLLVLDYAEARKREVQELAERLDTLRGSRERKIRVVLLARTAGEWWASLLREDERLRALFDSPVYESSALAMPALSSEAGRESHFNRSLQAFAPILQAQGYVASLGPYEAPSIRAAGEARPLAVQMEAMLWLASIPCAPSPPIDELVAQVLGLERSHWRRIVGRLDDDEERDLARGVAQVTLVQGVGSNRAIADLLMADPFFNDRTSRSTVDALVRRLTQLYGHPSRDGVMALEPDLIGEHHVAMTADQELIDGCVAWISTQPQAVRPIYEVNVTLVLQRASNQEHGRTANGKVRDLFEHLIERHAEALAPAMVVAVVSTPGALMQIVSDNLPKLPEVAVEAFNILLPNEHVSMMDLALRVAERHSQLAMMPMRTNDQGAEALQHTCSAADTLDRLSNRLSAIGRHSDALAASRQAVAMRRAVSADSVGRDSMARLRISLNNEARDLSKLGLAEEALVISEEALLVARSLAADGDDDHREDVSQALNNLARDLHAVGRAQEALSAIEEAVRIRRERSARRPEYTFELATSLNSLSGALMALGQIERGVAAARESVEIRRGLADAFPDRFRADFAGSLNNLSGALTRAERRQEAIEAISEAVSIRRVLAQERPLTFLPSLARTLLNRAALSRGLQEWSNSLRDSEESIAICRKLLNTVQQSLLPDLIRGLGLAASCLLVLNRSFEALAYCLEALQLATKSSVPARAIDNTFVEALLHAYRDAIARTTSLPDGVLVQRVLAKWAVVL
jgi:tetratricopeptide (TPR) repeat protein